MKLDEREKINTTRVIVMGLSGTGKSTLVSKLSSQYKLWWMTLDNDADILFKLSAEQKENIELFDIPDSAFFPVAADTLMKMFKNRKGEICHKHGIWNLCPDCLKNKLPMSSIDLSTLDPKKDILVIDTGSQLSHSILAKVTKNQPIDYKPERDDWGGLRKWTEFFYSEFQAARFNLVVIFHSITAEMEDGKDKLVPAFGSKDMSTKIAGAFSHIVYTEVANGKHRAFSSSTYSGGVLTKSRTDFLIERLAEPSLEPIFSGAIPAYTKLETPLPKEATENTPANSALSGLDRMLAEMKAKKAQGANT